MRRAAGVVFLGVLATCSLVEAAEANDRIRPAIDRVLPLLERAAAGSAEQRECYTCHNQGLPIVVLTEARRRSFTVDEVNLQRQIDHTYAHLNRNRERYSKGEGTGGKADTAGSALWALSDGARPADETTTAVAEYLLLWQSDDTHWTCSSDRPPSEASDFTTTYLSLRGLAAYGNDAQQERIAARTRSARDWLLDAEPQDNEDRVFRLWSLQLAGAERSAIEAAAADLIGRQRADGGWSQLDDQDSDAYATATALVALHETGSLPTTAETYQRGVDYLLKSQLEDGSWHVVSRSKPFQTYFESGFPHGTDQFISCAASAWAALALLATLPEDAPAVAAAEPVAAERRQYQFEVRETAGIRRRNDVITIGSSVPEIVGHKGSLVIRQAGKPIPAQVRRVEVPNEPPEVVVDFIGHFQPFETREYVLELSDGRAEEEPSEGLTLKETGDSYIIDSSGLVTWSIRKDLAGLLDFAWKETDYIADESMGLYFQHDGELKKISDRLPTRAAVERAGPIAVGLRFDYDDWPPGAHSTVHLEFPRTKSWIHVTWTVDGDLTSNRSLNAGLNLRVDGPETLIDFGAGDFVYTTVTAEETAVLHAGPRQGASVPWDVSHGSLATGGLHEVVSAPKDVPALRVPGWAHAMDDKRCTALAVAAFGEAASDSISVHGDGRLVLSRSYYDDNRDGVRDLEFWLHFVTMPSHIGARTSPRSMQEPLEVEWLSE